MRSILSAFFVLGLATSAHAENGWSSYLDIGTSYERGNDYDGNWNRVNESSQLNQSANAELQYKWNACAIGARATLQAVNYEQMDIHDSGYWSESEGYGIAGQLGCNINGLWFLGFGGVRDSEWRNSSSLVIPSYLEKMFGAGIYYRNSEWLGLGIAVSRLNTNYTDSDAFHVEFDTDTVTGKIDYFISPNLLFSTTASYSDQSIIKTGTLFTRLEFKPDGYNFSTYAGISSAFSREDFFEIDVWKSVSLTAKVGLRWYFSDGTLQAHYNNMMPTFE